MSKQAPGFTGGNDPIAALRAALIAAETAPEDVATDEDDEESSPVTPRAAAALHLSEVAEEAQARYAQRGDEGGESLCRLVSEICFYLVDPALRGDLLLLTGACLEALSGPPTGYQAQVDDLWAEFETLKPTDNDAAAVARALGMSEEEAAAFGLIGQVELDTRVTIPDDLEEEAEESAPTESLEELFRRKAREMVEVTIPRALQRYWGNQTSFASLLEVRRAFHTLKGDARVTAQNAEATDLEGLAEIAEAAEDIIDELLGDTYDETTNAPALPRGAFSLLGDARDHLARRLAAGEALSEDDGMLMRLHAMQERARGLREGTLGSVVGQEAGTEAPSAPLVAEPETEEEIRTDFLKIFLGEADKLMPDLHRALARLQDNGSDENALFQARAKMHTLKGSALLAGADAIDIGRVAHACEDMLEFIEDCQLAGSLTAIPEKVLTSVLDAEDALQGLLDGLRHKIEKQSTPDVSPFAASASDITDLLARLGSVQQEVQQQEIEAHEQAIEQEEAAASAESSEEAAPVAPTIPEPEGDGGLVPLPQLRHTTRAPALRPAEPQRPMVPVDSEELKEQRLRTALRGVEEQYITGETLRLLYEEMASQLQSSRQTTTRLRTLIDRLDRELGGRRFSLLEFGRQSEDWDLLEKEEYSEGHVLLMQLDEVLADQEDAETRLRRNMAEARVQAEIQAESLGRVQDALLDMSMVPLSSMEMRLDQMVRSIARRLGKTATFHMTGGEIGLDSRIAEDLINPLTLLINNAIDHGLESSEAERIALGKDPTGQISLHAHSTGDKVIMSLSDDGRGIDPERVVAMAVSKGMVDPMRAATMTPAERMALIWEAGFSTASELTQTSGRGMGMTSVRDALAALQGRIDVESTLGMGTTYTITLPRSLAMMRILALREGPNVVGVPIADVVATHTVAPGTIVEVAGGRAVHLADRSLAVYEAHLATGPSGDGLLGQYTLVEIRGRNGGFLVDEVLQSYYLPVRPAPAFLRRTCGLIGYAFGAGSVILPLLDMDTVVTKATPVLPLIAAAANEKAESAIKTAIILVVDDSQTMRRALSDTFKAAGFSVHEASSGQKALAVFNRVKPDLVTMDMEMPGMDGLETVSALRLLPEAATLPIFMITSRQQARHRTAALSAGVTRYFTKPYDPQELIGATRVALAARAAEARQEEAS